MASGAVTTPVSAITPCTSTGSTWTGATGVCFTASPTSFFAGADAFVNTGTGAFAPLIGTTADFPNFIFSPLSSPSQLWTPGTYAFSMTSLTIASQTSDPVSLTGAGTVTGGGESSDGTFTFQSSQSGGTFSFNSTAMVPVPATPGPMGLAGLGLASRRIRKT